MSTPPVARAMRIGIICPYSWDTPGGVRTHVADLAETLIHHGHEVQVLAPFDREPDEMLAFTALPTWLRDGGRPVSVPYNGSVARLNFGVKAARRVRRFIREGDFDVLHIHEPVAPGLSLLACWAAKGPIVATWHSANERSRILSAGYYIAQTAMEKIRGRIAVSEDARRTLVAHVGGDAVLIPNGVRIAPFADAAAHPTIDPAIPSVLFLGRVDEPRKGLDVLIRALPRVLAIVPEVQVVIAGPGAFDADALAAIPGVTAIALGTVSDRDKAAALHSATVYVAPHTGGESFGIVLIEALAAGTPVVASDIPAFRRVLLNGECGALFTSEDEHSLATTLIEVLTDAQRRASLRDAGAERVRDFDWDRVVADVLAVYEAVAADGEKVVEDWRGQFVGRLGGR